MPRRATKGWLKLTGLQRFCCVIYLYRLRLPFALGCLCDQPFFNGTGGYADVFHRAVLVDHLHALKVGCKTAFINFRYVSANATLFLRLTTSGNAATHVRAFSGNFANSSHVFSPVKGEEDSSQKDAGKFLFTTNQSVRSPIAVEISANASVRVLIP